MVVRATAAASIELFVGGLIRTLGEEPA